MFGYQHKIRQHLDYYEKTCNERNIFFSKPLIETILPYLKKPLDYINLVEKNTFLTNETKECVTQIYSDTRTAWNQITRCILKRVHHKRISCNTEDLSGTPFSEYKPEEYFYVHHNHKKYTFKHTDFYNLIQSSLLNADAFMIANPLPIKNPYTGIVFSTNMLYLIYLKLKHKPVLFLHFMETQFQIEPFLLTHEGLLRHYTIEKTLHEMTPIEFKNAILDMILDVSICNILISNSNVIQLKTDLNVMKSLVRHYYNFLYSLNPYQRQMEYKKLIKKMSFIQTQ